MIKPLGVSGVRVASLAWIVGWFGVALALKVAPGDPLAHRLMSTLELPGAAHWLGCDAFGRDLLALTLNASLRSAIFALAATLLTLAAGTLAGALMGVAEPRARFALERVLDGILAFPFLLFALAWAAIRGQGWATLLGSLLIASVPSLIRFMYLRTREILAEDYVVAARSLGGSPSTIARRHLLPALLPLARLKLPVIFAHALMAEATLSFIGVGAPIGRETWGLLLAQGKDYLIEAPHIAFASGLPLALTVFSLQMIASARADSRLES